MPELRENVSVSTCSNCLFDQPWWLDTVAPGKWSEASISKGGAVVARWPYVRKTRLGLTFLSQPPCTPALGPSLLLPDGKYATTLAKEKELLTKLIEELPTFHYMSQRFHYRMQNWLPFYWQGWAQTTRYTYVLEDLEDEDRLWSGLRDSTRREIRKASRRLEVHDDYSMSEVLRLQQLSFARQACRQPNHLAIFNRIENACRNRQCGKAFAAVDETGRTHAAIYLVWDERSAYYLLGGGDPEVRNSGAHSLVMWKAIQHAATVSRRFDFEGSMIEPIERFFRGFGARQQCYSKVSKVNSKIVSTALALRQLRTA